MIRLASAIHRAMNDFNARHPGRAAKIDSSLSRILALDADFTPRRADPQADKRLPKTPSIFTIMDIAKRLETTVSDLLGERVNELTTSDLEMISKLAAWANSKIDGSRTERPGITLKEEPGALASSPADIPPQDSASCGHAKKKVEGGREQPEEERQTGEEK